MQLHEPGTILDDRYRILELVGKGGMGAVYKARDLRLKERVVAVKQVVDDEDVDLKWVEERLEKESEVLEKLQHPGIPGILDHFMQGHARYVVMEFIEGTGLDQVLQSYLDNGQPMPQELALEFGLKICDVLIYLHEREPPVIHRDVKPQNVLVKHGTQDIVLVDFGLARAAEDSRTQTLVGTMGYAPLEQFKGHPEPRSDLYALGATLHHMISGERPTAFQIEPLATVYPQVHPTVAAVIDRAVMEKPDKRFANAKTMRAALRKALGELTGVIEDGPDNPKVSMIPDAREPMNPLVFSLLALVLVTLGLGAILLMSSLRNPPSATLPPVVSSSPTAPPTGPVTRPTRTRSPRPTQAPPPASTGGEVTVEFDPPDGTTASAAQAMLASPVWAVQGVKGLQPGGVILASPGHGGGVIYARTVELSPSRLSFRALRSQPCNLQVAIGNLVVQSAYAEDGYTTRLLTADGASSVAFAQSQSDAIDVYYSLRWGPNEAVLSSGANEVRLEGVAPSGMNVMTVLIASPTGAEAQAEVREIETE